MKKLIIIVGSLLILICLVLVILAIRFETGKTAVKEQWDSKKITRLKDIGTTRTLEVLPLVDWKVSNDALKGEPGVSYLVKTDTVTILFDVGFNRKEEDPSPLEQNMKRLGIDINDFQVIVISHNHPDHVGGFKWQSSKSFSISSAQKELKNKKVYTPVPMTYPGLAPVYSEDPIVIAKGVALTGTIASQLFFMGRIEEQALAVNVLGKGIVLIVGCGHQTVPKLIARFKALFKKPLYGIIGGLHFPVNDAPLKIMGIPMARYFGTGKFPWNPITKEEVLENIALLKKERIKIAALSAHDSCDLSISLFKKAFGIRFRLVRVGERIKI